MARSFDELLEFLNDQVAIRGESGESCHSSDAIMSEVLREKEHRVVFERVLFVYSSSYLQDVTSNASIQARQ